MPIQTKPSIEEGMRFFQQQAYWDGFAAGAATAAEKAKEQVLAGILAARQVTAPPAQTQPRTTSSAIIPDQPIPDNQSDQS
jgi:hypothetical protein